METEIIAETDQLYDSHLDYLYHLITIIKVLSGFSHGHWLPEVDDEEKGPL